VLKELLVLKFQSFVLETRVFKIGQNCDPGAHVVRNHVCRRFVRSSILKAQSDRRDLENSVLCPGKRSIKRFSIHEHLTPIYLKKVCWTVSFYRQLNLERSGGFCNARKSSVITGNNEDGTPWERRPGTIEYCTGYKH